MYQLLRCPSLPLSIHQLLCSPPLPLINASTVVLTLSPTQQCSNCCVDPLSPLIIPQLLPYSYSFPFRQSLLKLHLITVLPLFPLVANNHHHPHPSTIPPPSPFVLSPLPSPRVLSSPPSPFILSSSPYPNNSTTPLPFGD